MVSSIDKTKVLKAICRNDLAAFTRKAFEIVSPSDKYLHNWHINLISEYLMACVRGDITRLIINVPPRSMKSISIGVAFPAWILGRDPTKKFICASYSQDLSFKHSLDCRAVVRSPFYQDLFPNTKLIEDQNTKSKFMTTERGFRFSTSTTGTVTGEGADYIILDDPNSAIQANSQKFRDTTKMWFDQSITTRLNNKKTGVIIVVMQRLHQDDLTGHLLEKGGWHHLNIPLIAEQDTNYQIGNFNYSRKEGEILHPERFPEDEIARMKIAMGSTAFNSQYQQKPIADGGNIIKMEWIRTYKELPSDVKRYTWSWDTAIKAGQENDFSVGLLIAECHNGYYIIDCYKNKLEYPELRKMVYALYNKHKASEVLIEDKASGQQILQDFKRAGSMPVIAMMPGKDMPNNKEERMRLISPLFEAGKVFFPEDAPWLSDSIDELTYFPNSKHDDFCDSLSQYLARRLNMQSKAPNIRVL